MKNNHEYLTAEQLPYRDITRKQAEDVADLWHRRNETRIRNRIVENYLPLLMSCANTMFSRLKGRVSVDDLISYGTFGLIDAVDKYNPSREVRFEAYAFRRINGAILQEVRNIDWASRRDRLWIKRLNWATDYLYQKNERKPTDLEIAAYLNISIKKVMKIRRMLDDGVPTSLYRTCFGTTSDDETPEIDTLEDKRVEQPFQIIAKREFLKAVLRRLNKREKQVINRHYSLGMTLEEIAKDFGLVRSRISQIHTGALRKIKLKLEKRLKPEECIADLFI